MIVVSLVTWRQHSEKRRGMLTEAHLDCFSFRLTALSRAGRSDVSISFYTLYSSEFLRELAYEAEAPRLSSEAIHVVQASFE